jgi:hypothetical protein
LVVGKFAGGGAYRRAIGVTFQRGAAPADVLDVVRPDIEAGALRSTLSLEIADLESANGQYALPLLQMRGEFGLTTSDIDSEPLGTLLTLSIDPVRTWLTATEKPAMGVPLAEKRSSASLPRLPKTVTRNMSLVSSFLERPRLDSGLAHSQINNPAAPAPGTDCSPGLTTSFHQPRMPSELRSRFSRWGSSPRPATDCSSPPWQRRGPVTRRDMAV